jgi:tetratricopeptide (TPR) repeat protein
MKKLFSLLIVLLTLPLISQEKDGDKSDSKTSVVKQLPATVLAAEARGLFNEGMYTAARNKYKSALNLDPNHFAANIGLSEIYLIWMNYKYAVQHAEVALKYKEDPPYTSFVTMGQIQHKLGDFDKALENFEKAKLGMKTNEIIETEIDKKIAEAKRAPVMIKDSVDVYVMNMGDKVNSKWSEYSAVVSDSALTMYFTSRRPDTKGGNKASDNNYFEDVYVVKREAYDMPWSEATNELRFNSEGHDNLSYVSDDGSFALFTVNTSSNSDFGNDKNATKSADIYISKLSKKGKWGRTKPIADNLVSSYADMCPTMTSDASIMYFTSERLGGAGGMDIYYTKKSGSGWTEPVNCLLINTPANETTPFISADGNHLFFSTNGRDGMGGMDIYVTEVLAGNTFTSPNNLGYPINSRDNDLFFRYYPDLQKAYISSVRDFGFGLYDIYEIDMSNWTIPKQGDDSEEIKQGNIKPGSKN